MKPLQSGTQKKVILDYLMKGNEITKMQGFRMGITKADTRISELRKMFVKLFGERIIDSRDEVSTKITFMRKLYNRLFGLKLEGAKRYKVYFITPENRVKIRTIQ